MPNQADIKGMSNLQALPTLPWVLPLSHLRITSPDDQLAHRAVQAMGQWLALLPQPPACKVGPGLIKVIWGRPLTRHCVGWTQPHWVLTGAQKRLQAITITVVESPLIDQQLSSKQQLDRLAATLLHEMGHALGLDHVPQPQAVMHAQGWQNQALSPWDAELIRQKYPPTR
jgi:Matrixin